MLLAVYGSLREGQPMKDSIIRRFGHGSMRYQGSFWLEGFCLYDLGYYPCAVQASKRQMFIDVFELDEDAARYIDSIEHGAGYYHGFIKVLSKLCSIYLYKPENVPQEATLIGTGDWSSWRIQR